MHKYTLTSDSFVINDTKRDVVSFKDPGDVGRTFDIIRCGEVIYKDLDLFDNCREGRGKIFIWNEKENLDIRDGDEIQIISSTEKYFRETSKYRLASSN
jgi:hypothetical protein